MPITILQLAEFRGAKAEEGRMLNMAEFIRVGLPIAGGCEGCGASIAAYNAHPSKTGYLRCAVCIGALGYETTEEANREIFGPVGAEFTFTEEESALVRDALLLLAGA